MSSSFASSYQYSNVPAVDDPLSDVNSNKTSSQDSSSQQRSTQQQQSELQQSQLQPPSAKASISQQKSFQSARAYNPSFNEYPQSHYMNPMDSSHSSWLYNSNATSSGSDRKNRFLIGSIVFLFLLIITAHHNRIQNKIDPVTSNNKGISGDNPVEVPPGKSVVSHTSAVTNEKEIYHPTPSPPERNPVEVLPSDNDGKIDSDPKIPPKPIGDPIVYPTLTYLLAYPMSGATFTSLLLQAFTNTNTATNRMDLFYHEHAQKSKDMSSVFPNDPTSPFWAHGLGYNQELKHPPKHVLTQTHCHGYCTGGCRPEEYLMTESVFDEACRTVHHGASTNLITGRNHWDENKKTIHLVRGPFSNVVSRYHAWRWEQEVTSGERNFKYYESPTDKDKFRKWCKDMDENDDNEASDGGSLIKHSSFSLELKEKLRKVPCRREFFKYLQWHSLATKMKKNSGSDHRSPTSSSLTLYYETYKSEVEILAAAVDMARFLELDILDFNKQQIPDFMAKARTYDDYFSDEEKRAVEEFVRTLLVHDGDTWDLIKRYFVPQ